MQQHNHILKPIQAALSIAVPSLLIILLLVSASCQRNKKPEGLLDEKKMVELMTDVHLVDGFVSTVMYNDTLKINKKDYYQSVYRKHKTSEAVYLKSLKYYSKDPQLLDTLYDRVDKKLTEKENKLNKANQPAQLPTVQ